MTSERIEPEPDPAATRVQPTTASGSLPVLAAQAHERAPTLMAGATAGRQGEVKIWTPKRWLIWSRIGAGLLFILMALILSGVCPFIPRSSVFGRVYVMVLFLMNSGMFLSVMKNIRTPATYLSTDENGLAISTATGSRALRWDDFESVGDLAPDPRTYQLRLRLKSRECVELNLAGYTDHRRRQLLSLLERKLTRRILFGDPSVIGKCWIPGIGPRCGAPAHHVDEQLGYAICNHHAKLLQGKRRKALPAGRRNLKGGRMNDEG